jgi:D-alanyl-lipoteichoic acid acyltransferase DltB (MBOAT superfamily)
MKKFIRFWEKFFLMVWEIIKSMKSLRGLIALFMSYMIFHGWAVLFLVFGTFAGNAFIISIGTAVILFWFGPGTPVIPLIIITALFIRRYILFEKTEKLDFKAKWKELNQKFKD